VVVRQVPILLLVATAILSLPFLAFSLFHVLKGTDAEGKWFSLFFGLLMGWLLLEFAATRGKLEIDLSARTMSRTVSGVFRRRRQSINLAQMKQINLQVKKDWRGRRYDYLYICGDDDQYLLNNPRQTLNHRATGKLLSDLTGLPYDVTGPVPLNPATR
jgi:hypothetical protein